MQTAPHKIICLNLDGKISSIIALETLIRQHQPLVCLLQDIPRLSERSLNTTCQAIASNYMTIYDRDYHMRYKRIDNMILLDKERAQSLKIHLYSRKSKANALGVSFCRFDNTGENTGQVESGKLISFSVYIRPRATHHETKHCLDWLHEISSSNEGHSRTIIMGDMNASDPSWCPFESITENQENSQHHYRQIKIVRGRAIAKFMDKLKLTCLNRSSQGPTFENSWGKSYIDLAFVGNKAIRTWNALSITELEPSSSHKALILKAEGSIRTRYRYKTFRRIKPDLLNSSHFEEVHLQCDSLCVNWRHLPRDRIIKRMDRITNVTYSAIKLAQEKITIETTRKTFILRKAAGKGISSVRIRRQLHRLRKQESRAAKYRGRLIWMKRKERARLQGGQGNVTSQSQRQSGPNISTYTNLKRRTKSIANRIRRIIIDNLNRDNMFDSMNNLAERDLWSRVHLIERGLDSVNSDITNNCNAINKQEDIEKLVADKFPYRERQSLNYVSSAYNRDTNSTKIYLGEDEVARAINDIRGKTYTSSVGIRMDIFFRSIEYMPNIIKTLVEMSYWACYIPKRACVTQGTLIPKKAPGQFRIVHVSSPLAALLEIIALRRLEHKLEVARLNSPYQFGFSALVSRHDLIARIIEFFYKEYFEVGKKATGLIISLDIEGAFDNVNQDMLIRKMDEELGEDPIKYWLAEFVLNRRISVKRGKLSSDYRDICLGVPQGSALGPVLWNYMIHDIDKQLVRPTRTELVRYADDIILIYNGINKNIVQSTINGLVEKLKAIDLNIRPEKCSTMGVKLEGYDRRSNAYYIKGEPIKNVRNMNILGIPLTSKLKLNRKSEEHRVRFLINIKKLYDMNKLGLINSAKEWRILIESYIKSRLIVNNWPVLILDHRACKWIDDQMIKALRIIFNWPSNTSTKLIRLITGTTECREIVLRMAKHRALSTEYSRIYNFLLKISPPNYAQRMVQVNHDERSANSNSWDRINLETDLVYRRKHPDPTKFVKITEITSFWGEVNSNGPTWIILDREMGSMMAEIDSSRQITQFKLGRHSHYSISYFNSFSLLYKYVTDETITNRSLTLSETNSILAALENAHNRDWRIIQLRERMYTRGWRIYKIKYCEENRLRMSLAASYRNINLRHDSNMIINDFRLWLEHNDRITEGRMDETETRPTFNVESLHEPYLADYKGRNHMNKRMPIEDNSFFLRCHTSVTRELALDVNVWQSITPNWIDGAKMIALAGMTTNGSGQLEHGDRAPSDACHLCEHYSEPDLTRSNYINWPSNNELRIKSNLVLHKTLVCRACHNERTRFMSRIKVDTVSDRAIREGRSTTEKIISNRRMCQRFLRLMVECNSKQ